MAKNVVVLGTQWGDEGKGKIVDLLTENVTAVVRFQGKRMVSTWCSSFAHIGRPCRPC